MNNNANWTDKYLIAISEFVTLKDIMILRNCGYNQASSIRQKALKYCEINHIECYGRLLPTESVLKVTNRDINFYYDKMILEKNVLGFA